MYTQQDIMDITKKTKALWYYWEGHCNITMYLVWTKGYVYALHQEGREDTEFIEKLKGLCNVLIQPG